MARLTYREMAETLGVEHCRGMKDGFYCRIDNHGSGGFATPGVVHLAEPSQVDRRDALQFLRLAVLAMDPSLNDDIPWRRVYRRYVGVRDMAARLQMRFPPRHWSTDKAFVLASVAGLNNEVPLRREAFNWARRTGR